MSKFFSLVAGVALSVLSAEAADSCNGRHGGDIYKVTVFMNKILGRTWPREIASQAEI